MFLCHCWQNGSAALPRDLFSKGDSQTGADFPDLPHPGRRQRGAKEALLKGLPSRDLREPSQGFLTCMGVHHEGLGVASIGSRGSLEKAVARQLYHRALYRLKGGQAAQNPLLKGSSRPSHN